jgi:hypothetical protein
MGREGDGQQEGGRGPKISPSHERLLTTALWEQNE